VESMAENHHPATKADIDPIVSSRTQVDANKTGIPAWETLVEDMLASPRADTATLIARMLGIESPIERGFDKIEALMITKEDLSATEESSMPSRLWH